MKKTVQYSVWNKIFRREEYRRLPKKKQQIVVKRGCPKAVAIGPYWQRVKLEGPSVGPLGWTWMTPIADWER